MTIYLQGKPVDVPQTGLDYLSPGQTAFAILRLPRAIPEACIAPAKRGPKPKPKITKAQESARAMETLEERRARQLQMNSAPKFNVPIAPASDAITTGRIQGRRNAARSQ